MKKKLLEKINEILKEKNYEKGFKTLSLSQLDFHYIELEPQIHFIGMSNRCGDFEKIEKIFADYTEFETSMLKIEED